MNLKKYISALIVVGSFCTNVAKAQTINLEERPSVTEKGYEYGYLMKNEQTKTVKGDEYSRYEITFFITNKTRCTKLFEDREKFSIGDMDPNKLAIFDCLNANGKRFTSKKASVDAKDFFVRCNFKINDKEETRSVKAGFIFRNGETRTQQYYCNSVFKRKTKNNL
jgi:hypothetical protein